MRLAHSQTISLDSISSMLTQMDMIFDMTDSESDS